MNINCPLENHKEQKLIAICMDKNCKQKRLCCLYCVNSSHQGHGMQLVEIEKVAQFIQQESNKSPSSYSPGQSQIIKELEQLENQIDSLQKIVQERLKKMKAQNLHEYLEKFNNWQQGIQYWNEIILGLLQYVQVENYQLTKNKSEELKSKEQKSVQILKSSNVTLGKLIANLNGCPMGQIQFSKKPQVFSGHQEFIDSIVISSDGAIVASASSDKLIYIWDTRTQQVKLSIKQDGFVYKMALSSDNKYLAFGNTNDQIELYNLKENKQFKIDRKKQTLTNIIFSQDTQFLLSGEEDKKIILWNVITRKQSKSFEVAESIENIVISYDNNLISCIGSSTINIWDSQKQENVLREAHNHEEGIGLSSSPDLSILISSGCEGVIKIWKFDTLEKGQRSLTLTLQIQAFDKCVDKIILSSDEQYIISTSRYEEKIKIYERDSGSLIQILESGTKSEQQQVLVCSYFPNISISKDMNVLISSNGKDKNVRIWTTE